MPQGTGTSLHRGQPCGCHGTEGHQPTCKSSYTGSTSVPSLMGTSGWVPSLLPTLVFYKLSFFVGSLPALFGPNFDHCHRIRSLSGSLPRAVQEGVTACNANGQHRLSGLGTLTTSFSGMPPSAPQGAGGSFLDIMWDLH